ncbi:hypothetical protein I3J27_21490 [Bradyrhizobium xenonodulans]|uniref:Uncharacterized protein n=1 Tax=Bradyrhizobium xenonodulans TaxID=2736875 RepID=A0ABY7MDF4_9BRAD|nr:hypothetical protein [Bradyrhizobium xenonodulans]WBL75609.1 hypothetical protein I3J27_21490 [Bradyrhizobium xenonodulans]
MPYFTSKQTRDIRICKVLADVFCALLLLTFSIVFFGWLGGLIAFIIAEAGLLAVDWLVPSEDDAAAVVR